MTTYRSKVVEIEAFKLPHPYYEPVEWILFKLWASSEGLKDFDEKDDGIIIPTLEGNMLANYGDYVIKGLKGEFYPCKPEIFAMKYELVGE